MSTTVSPLTPQGDVIALGIPDSQDYPRLVYTAPYFQVHPLAELIAPTVTEAVEAQLPSLVPPYVNQAAEAAVQQLAVLLTGSTMSGPLMLAPLMPTADSMAATKAYVDAMVATAGVPEVPLVPTGQTWARQTGQWVPISEQEGTFLPLAGGTMQGQINMSGYAINNLAALPNMPNGAAPATWVLQQIASVSLYQGTWNMDTYTPDLTNPNTHVNGYTWIAITTSTSGVVIGPAIPGLQGQTVFNGDTIIWSNIQGQFNRIHSGGLSLAEAQALFLPFTGGTMTGPLLAFENPTATMEVATMGWVESLLPPGGVIPEAPTDGQLYGRNGLTKVWLPVLPLSGGVMTGPILLSGNATNALNPVPLQQLTSTLAATYMPLAGGTMTGPLVLSGNASANLNPVPLQQVNAMLGGYIPLSGGTLTGPLTLSANAASPLQPVTLQQLQAGYLPLAGGTITGSLVVNQNAAISGSLTLGGNAGAALQAVPYQQLTSYVAAQGFATTAQLAGYLPLSGGSLTGNLSLPSNTVTAVNLTATSTVTGTSVVANTGGILCGGNGIAFGAGNEAVLFVPAAGPLVSTLNLAFNGNTTNGPVAVTSGSITNSFVAIQNIAINSGGAGCTAWYPGGSVGWATTASDRRLKTNLAAATVDALAVIESLMVYSCDFDNKFPGSTPQHWNCAVIADEVQAAVPEAFIPAPDANGYQSVNVLPLVCTLWRAVQQLTARVGALDGRAA